jgi:hypothetical protein
MKMTLGFFGAYALHGLNLSTPESSITPDKPDELVARLKARVGTLEVGKLADLAVLSQDIFRADPLAIGKTRVTMTMVGGKIVYRAQQ